MEDILIPLIDIEERWNKMNFTFQDENTSKIINNMVDVRDHIDNDTILI